MSEILIGSKPEITKLLSSDKIENVVSIPRDGLLHRQLGTVRGVTAIRVNEAYGETARKNYISAESDKQKLEFDGWQVGFENALDQAFEVESPRYQLSNLQVAFENAFDHEFKPANPIIETPVTASLEVPAVIAEATQIAENAQKNMRKPCFIRREQRRKLLAAG